MDISSFCIRSCSARSKRLGILKPSFNQPRRLWYLDVHTELFPGCFLSCIVCTCGTITGPVATSVTKQSNTPASRSTYQMYFFVSQPLKLNVDCRKHPLKTNTLFGCLAFQPNGAVWLASFSSPNMLACFLATGGLCGQETCRRISFNVHLRRSTLQLCFCLRQTSKCTPLLVTER